MTEELEELERLTEYFEPYEDENNANPSEAMECLKSLDIQVRFMGILDIPSWEKYLPTIKNYIIKSQEQEKVLKIIFEKGVDVGYLKTCKTLEEYNSNCWNDDEDFNKKLTQEEFDEVKRWIK